MKMKCLLRDREKASRGTRTESWGLSPRFPGRQAGFGVGGRWAEVLVGGSGVWSRAEAVDSILALRWVGLEQGRPSLSLSLLI